ncbi:MAG: type IV secretion system DNA-binding domain-containing protein [Armatimonadota bacterium]
MSFWSRLLGYEDEKRSVKDEDEEPGFHNEYIPGTFDLGLYYSENKNEIQVAKFKDEDRATHLYVIGATGTGKTKFLESLIRQDIEKGNGFCVIDPHGDLIEDIKGFLACRYLADETDVFNNVILIDPTDPDITVTFNPLEKMPGVSVAEQAGELVSSFRKIWSDSWGARMEDLMRNSLIALGEAELTLCELTSFLTRRSFRQVVLEKVKSPTAMDYFQRFDSLTDRGQITWIEPVMNKINAFLADERMRQMFSSPKSSFQFREAMDSRKHILIKLDKGKLKGSSDLLGSLFMAKIQMAAFSRSDQAKSQRVPFYLYIDEFQNFATESFKVVLSESRKYGLSLVMAHQSLSQISDELRNLILGSAGLQVYFRVNRQDAQTLAKEAFQYSGNWEREIEELQHLQPRMCYTKHKIEGDIIQLHTMSVESAPELLGVSEEEYQDIIPVVPIGMKYVVLREELVAKTNERQQKIEEAAKSKEPIKERVVENRPAVVSNEANPEPVPKQGTEQLRQIVSPEQPAQTKEPKATRKEVVGRTPREIKFPEVEPKRDPKIEREHKRLQHLIKKLAEQSGYLATIEQPTTDGQGRVDVGLERDGRRIACEVSVTTSPEHELANIQKCLASEYELVILCSPEKKVLNKIKTLCNKELSEIEQQKVLFFEPDELVFYFEEEAAKNAGREDRIKGYKVKVNFQPVDENEKKAKRQVLAQVFLRSFHPQKKEDNR